MGKWGSGGAAPSKLKLSGEGRFCKQSLQDRAIGMD